MIIGVDFDGTIVEHMYPALGPPVPGAIEKMLLWQEQGHQLILWTMRHGFELELAVSYLTAHGIKLYGVNENPHQKSWTQSPKAHCHVYIDDAAYGCPLMDANHTQRPMVDWGKIDIT